MSKKKEKKKKSINLDAKLLQHSHQKQIVATLC